MSTSFAPDTASLSARIDRAREATAAAGIDALFVAPGSDLRYLLGVGGKSFERLTCLVLPAAGLAAEPTLVVPALERPGFDAVPTDRLGVGVRTWVDGDDPFALAVGSLGTRPARVAVTDMMAALHVIGLRRESPDTEQTLAGPVLRELRMRKDDTELAALRRAGETIDRVHANMGEWLRAGRTEAEVGADIAAAIVAEGHAVAEFVIVGSGPNGASPHHGVSDRVIQQGDVVVVDIGGPLPEGYNSDSTRTYVIGEPAEPDVLATYEVLQRAQQAAVDIVRPGVTAATVDATARQIIGDAGFGDRFIHRTGHGIGLDVHEDPYIVTGNDMRLEPGMAFSVEPGIYLSGRWGARIEDIVVVTEHGVLPLNNRPHDLVAL